MKKRKWTSFDEILSKYVEVYKELGHIPTRKELVERKLSGIENAVQKYGGMNKLYEAINIEPKQKKNYLNKESIISELKSIIEEDESFPTQRRLRELGRGDLLYAINKRGGINKYRLSLGYELLQVPDEFYKDINNVIEIIKQLKQRINRMPTIVELEEFKPGIKFAIRKYHGGYRKIRDILGEKQYCVENGYWDDFKNISLAITNIINRLGRVVRCNDIVKESSGLYAAIVNKHGGLNEVLIKMGFNVKGKSGLEHRVKKLFDKYVIETEVVDNKKKLLKDKYGIILNHPVTKNKLELDRFYPKFMVAIEVQGIQHYEECEYFAKQKGVSAKEYLRQIQEIDKYKQDKCEEYGIKLLTIKYNMTDDKIIELIKKNLPVRNEIVDIDIFEKEQFNNKIREVLEKLSEKNEFITSDMVRSESQEIYKLIISNFGGINNARIYFGFPEVRVARGLWTKEETMKRFVDAIETNKGVRPNKEFILNKEKKLYYAIVKHGGLRKLYREYKIAFTI